MHIMNLTLRNFRNYSEVHIQPDGGLNILLGKNAQGKSSLLEAIYMLATARSWRAGRESEMIRWDSDYAAVTARIARDEQNDIDMEIILARLEKKQIKVNTIRQHRLADILGKLNVVFISPLDGEIVRGDPSERRRFLNLELSQIQPQYCHLLVGYRKVIEQKNRLLKELAHRGMQDGELSVWNEQLVSYGSQILERRLAFLDRLSHLAGVIHSQFTDGAEKLGIRYNSGIEIGDTRTAVELAEKTRKRMSERVGDEMRRGVSLVGPHRDDLVFSINDVDARTYGSQGQQKTVALSLRLAELELMEELVKEPPIVLLDDVLSDLDEERRAHVFEMTVGRCQTFATTSSLALFDKEFAERGTIFDVSAGSITKR